MLVREFICNKEFDCNCNYEIYDCTEKGKQWHCADIIYSTRIINLNKSLDKVLDMKIKYITTDDSCIIIEGEFQ